MGKKRQAKEAKRRARLDAARNEAISVLVGEVASRATGDGNARSLRAAQTGLQSGRVTTDRFGSTFFGNFNVIVPPTNPDQTWRRLALDANALDRLPAHRLVELIIDLSPDVAKAVWDYQRLINSGFEVHAYKVGSKNYEKNDIDPKGEKALQGFIKQLGLMYGSFDIPINRLSMSIFMRGALLGELILGEDAKTPVDFATPDPAIVRFLRKPDPIRGFFDQPGQFFRGQFVAYERPTICYIPVDPPPDSPYGRALVNPAIFSTLFLLGLLHDLRRVISQQGYPRIDITVNLQKIKDLMPPELEGDTVEFASWVKGAISEVKLIYARLQPDDAYIHNDAITVSQPVSAMNAQGLGIIGEIIKALERMSVRALKSMPLMMGTTDGASEANANRQWEIFAAGIKSIQHLIENLFERLLTLALEAQGIAAVVKMRLAENRAAELLRDAQTEQIQITNERDKYNMGYTTLNEGAQALTGHDAAETEPRNSGPAPIPPAADLQADPGSNRTVVRIRTKKGVIRLQGIRETVTPDGVEAGLLPVPGVVEITDDEFNRYIREWERAELDTYEGLLDAEVA